MQTFTQQEQIQFIREKAIEANPDILKLEFGCKLLDTSIRDTGIWTLIHATQLKGYPRLLVYRDDIGTGTGRISEFEIIGRNVRLADVLYAIKIKNRGNGWTYAATAEGEIIKLEWDDHEVVATWNLLKDSLDDQSPETIQFIYNLLK